MEYKLTVRGDKFFLNNRSCDESVHGAWTKTELLDIAEKLGIPRNMAKTMNLNSLCSFISSKSYIFKKSSNSSNSVTPLSVNSMTSSPLQIKQSPKDPLTITDLLKSQSLSVTDEGDNLIGREIGAGSVGCVYRKSLKCVDDPFECKDCVTKRFVGNTGYDNEVIMADKVINADPDGKYHFKKLHNCEKSQKIKVTPECDGFFSLIHPLIFYEAGEKDLSKIVIDIIKLPERKKLYLDILKKLYNIFMAIEFFVNKGLIHFDIRKENIVSSNGGEYKLIDFGLMRDVETIVSEYAGDFKTIDFTIFLKIYFAWPPEVYYLSRNVINDNKNSSNAEIIKAYNIFSHLYVDMDHRLFRSTNFNVLFKIMMKNLKIFDKISFSDKTSFSDTRESIKNILSKIDVFGLGTTLNIMHKIGQQFQIDENILDKISSLVDEMVDLDYTTRISASDARKKYEAILQML